jgi:hypothetical protein
MEADIVAEEHRAADEFNASSILTGNTRGAGFVAAKLIAEPFQNLSRYETTIECSLHRALHELDAGRIGGRITGGAGESPNGWGTTSLTLSMAVPATISVQAMSEYPPPAAFYPPLAIIIPPVAATYYPPPNRLRPAGRREPQRINGALPVIIDGWARYAKGLMGSGT